LMTGISLKTEELMKSVSNMKFNSAVQIFNLGILTISVYGASRLFIMWGMNQDLANGMVICGEFKHRILVVYSCNVIIPSPYNRNRTKINKIKSISTHVDKHGGSFDNKCWWQ
jgi:hypothetical protein